MSDFTLQSSKEEATNKTIEIYKPFYIACYMSDKTYIPVDDIRYLNEQDCLSTVKTLNEFAFSDTYCKEKFCALKITSGTIVESKI